SSAEPSRKTRACRAVRSRGCTPSSGGISGKTAAPGGTSPAGGEGSVMTVLMGGSRRSPGIRRTLNASGSAPRDGGDDAHIVAVLDRRRQIVEVADVLIVEIDVDEAAHLSILEESRRDAGILLAEIVEQVLDRAAGGLDDGLVVGMLPHGRGDVDAYGH